MQVAGLRGLASGMGLGPAEAAGMLTLPQAKAAIDSAGIRVILWIGAAGTKFEFSSTQGPGEPALLLNLSYYRQRYHYPKVQSHRKGSGDHS